MNAPAPVQLRSGDYARAYPQAVKHEAETDAEFAERFERTETDNRTSARETMRRQGCRSIRFEAHELGQLIAHGYVARMSGPMVEDL